MPQNSRANENGGALLYVFIGLALFAALMFTFSNSRTGSSASNEKSDDINSSEIISSAQSIAAAVSKLQYKGCSDNEISFENSIVSGYTNPNSPSDKRCHVFDSNGGGKIWPKPPPNSNNGSAWVFTNNKIGTFDGTTANMGSIKAELVMILPNVTNSLCDKINKQLNNPPVWESGGSHMMAKFTGTYNFDNGGGTTISRGNLVPLLSTACFCDGPSTCNPSDPRYFYQVLSIR